MAKDLKFERTVWADRQLAKLCPNNDIKRFGELMGTDDFDKQMGSLIQIIRIMNEGYERKAHFNDPAHEIDVITEEELENFTEDELMELVNKAFEAFGLDGEQMVEIEQKAKKKEEMSV